MPPARLHRFDFEPIDVNGEALRRVARLAMRDYSHGLPEALRDVRITIS